MKYPLIKDLGLDIQTHGLDYVFAKHLEELLSEGVEVSNYDGERGAWTTELGEHDRHKGLLIGVKPIRKETCRDVLEEIMKDLTPYSDPSGKWFDRAKAAIDREQE